VLEPERRASETFLRRVLREGADQAFVVEFDEKVDVLPEAHFLTRRIGSGAQAPVDSRQCDDFVISPVQEASENIMRKQTGRKAFIAPSDGMSSAIRCLSSRRS
jgi:hypothetical protein